MREVKIIWSMVLLAVLLICCVNTVYGKRAFAIRMRSKNPSSSGGLSRHSRKNYQQAHMTENVSGSMVRNPPVPDAQPGKSTGGWNADTAGPVGPPPAYPGLSHHAVPAGGAPPAYSRIAPPSYAEAMGYSSQGNGYGAAVASGRHYDYHTHQNNLHGPYNDNNIGSYGSNYGYHRGSNPFSVGNILTGVALWQLGHGLAHAGHHHNHYAQYQNYYEHKHESSEDKVGTTLEPEYENPHIQVNADFDFGPSAAAPVETVQRLATPPTAAASVPDATA